MSDTAPDFPRTRLIRCHQAAFTGELGRGEVDESFAEIGKSGVGRAHTERCHDQSGRVREIGD